MGSERRFARDAYLSRKHDYIYTGEQAFVKPFGLYFFRENFFRVEFARAFLNKMTHIFIMDTGNQGKYSGCICFWSGKKIGEEDIED
ncbi:MAG: hypothetical protein D6820_08625 [Lentisphaerae bacterium]|nr:MAG: hypothetical protein D6820_08625 [Lentisphaerota bacterium]